MRQTKVKGMGHAYFETGTEGVYWSVWEEGKEHYYESLHILKTGDYLEVYSPYTNQVVWAGTVKLEYESHLRVSPFNPEYKQQEVYGFWVHGLQENVDPGDWGIWFLKSYPMSLTKGNGV